ncbi:MAG TPA: ATP-dependent helicase [Gaiellaceae bacterium]|nr:ATP-dependent helicase [Gaiellaceae bacterium]
MTIPAEVSSGLNPEQRRAVELVRGPVVILAGAGSGKTTTITRRIANQVFSNAFKPTEILAVTFTRKAAEELKSRLAHLGVAGVPARTFHAAAQRQIRYFANERRRVASNKYPLLYPLVKALPQEHRTVAVGDLGSEIERARNRRVTPETYLASLGGHEPPLPPELMAELFRGYEQAKRDANAIDHEDQLELAIRVFETDERAIETFRERYRAFTVDEFQDVNLLQWTLLSLWLGDRDELCAVGDDYQSIFGFTGATPRYLLSLPERFPAAVVVTLDRNYRSTHEVVSFANRLTPYLDGQKKTLVAGDVRGPAPSIHVFRDYDEEAEAIAARCVALHRAGTPLSELAILYRVNHRSPAFEAALLEAGLPFVAYGGAFLGRRAAKQLLPRLGRKRGAPELAAIVASEAVAVGLLEQIPPGTGPAEQTRQADLARFVSLAEDYTGGDQTVGGFLVELERRFGPEVGRDAVQLLSYHSAKGLEWEAVFLPRIEEGELPHWRATKDAKESEERRLLYVGITRAKRHLWLSSTREGRPSPFLAELSGPLSLPGTTRPPGGRSGPPQHASARPTRAAVANGAGPKRGWVPEWVRKRRGHG